MIDLSVKYLGLTLKNPIIIGSCSLTGNIESLKQLEENGAGAVVLKSIFEEEILREAEYELNEACKDSMIYTQLSETMDYIDLNIKEKNVSQYIQLIHQAKKELLIPVIASINCVSSFEWIEFASKIQEAGADAIELNIFINQSPTEKIDIDANYTEIISKLKKKISIPIAIKISSVSANLNRTIANISNSGADGIVMFNRFYSPDIDLNNLKVINSGKYSNPDDYSQTLRWVALVSDNTKCSIAANTGIHSGETIIKQILAGADAVQVVSSVYQQGAKQINVMLNSIETWMQQNGFNYIDQFKGKLSNKNPEAAAAFERIQFMKYFGNI